MLADAASSLCRDSELWPSRGFGQFVTNDKWETISRVIVFWNSTFCLQFVTVSWFRNVNRLIPEAQTHFFIGEILVSKTYVAMKLR